MDPRMPVVGVTTGDDNMALPAIGVLDSRSKSDESSSVSGAAAGVADWANPAHSRGWDSELFISHAHGGFPRQFSR
jgi:hypothetical protein